MRSDCCAEKAVRRDITRSYYIPWGEGLLYLTSWAHPTRLAHRCRHLPPIYPIDFASTPGRDGSPCGEHKR